MEELGLFDPIWKDGWMIISFNLPMTGRNIQCNLNGERNTIPDSGSNISKCLASNFAKGRNSWREFLERMLVKEAWNVRFGKGIGGGGGDVTYCLIIYLHNCIQYTI